MTYDVRAGGDFWHALAAIPDHQYLRIFDEASQVAFTLLDYGPELPDSRPQLWPVGGEAVVMGRAVDLRSEDGFVVYFSPEDLGHDYIYVADLEMYDWFDE